MIVEQFLSRYMQHKSSGILAFKEGGGHQGSQPPPAPEASRLLYVHVPFCNELCPYCSFNRVKLQIPLADEYFDALSTELDLYQEAGYTFGSVYVGGGTPTVLPERLAETIQKIRHYWNIGEVSIETNPDHLAPRILEKLKQAGVNRLSVGVQSFSDEILKKVNRYDKYGSSETIQRGIQETLGMFDTLNVDMIFNFPYQSEDHVSADLEILRDLEPDQVTWYPLMASKSVRKRMRETWGRIGTTRERDLYRLIAGKLSESGYHRSTAWCFSRGDGMIDEYVVNHNEYAGVGSGSFGYIGGSMYSNTFSIQKYIERLSKKRWPIERNREFTEGERARYIFLMNLFGGSLDLDMVAKSFDGNFTALLWKELLFMRITGGVVKEGSTLRVHGPGFYYLVIMMREFFTGVNNFRSAMMPEGLL